MLFIPVVAADCGTLFFVGKVEKTPSLEERGRAPAPEPVFYVAKEDATYEVEGLVEIKTKNAGLISRLIAQTHNVIPGMRVML